MDWNLIFSVVAVICLVAASIGWSIPKVPIHLGWIGLAIWATLSLF